MNVALFVAISLFFGLSRFAFDGHPVSPWGAWEAFAHIWCGFLIGVGLFGCRRARPWAWWSLAAISAIELGLFLVYYFGG